MSLINISDLNPAGSDLFATTDSFMTELQETEATLVYGGSGSNKGGYGGGKGSNKGGYYHGSGHSYNDGHGHGHGYGDGHHHRYNDSYKKLGHGYGDGHNHPYGYGKKH